MTSQLGQPIDFAVVFHDLDGQPRTDLTVNVSIEDTDGTILIPSTSAPRSGILYTYTLGGVTVDAYGRYTAKFTPTDITNVTPPIGIVTENVVQWVGNLDAAVSTRATTTIAQDIQNRLPASLTGAGSIKSDALAINGSTAAAAQLARSAATIVNAAAIAGTLSTTQMSTDLTEATNDHYKGRIIIWTSGTLVNQATDITAYNGTTKVLTFTLTTEAPLATDTFVIV